MLQHVNVFVQTVNSIQLSSESSSLSLLLIILVSFNSLNPDSTFKKRESARKLPITQDGFHVSIKASLKPWDLQDPPQQKEKREERIKSPFANNSKRRWAPERNLYLLGIQNLQFHSQEHPYFVCGWLLCSQVSCLRYCSPWQSPWN